MKNLLFIFTLLTGISGTIAAQKTPPDDEHSGLIELTKEQVQEFIDTHNKWRSQVNVPDLTWSNDLANYAAEWAVKQGKKNCNMKHRPDNPYGENLFWASYNIFEPATAVNEWGEEIKDYKDEVVGKTNEMVGHYTQIVWKTTSEVGCAVYKCKKSYLVVCNYNPSVNWI